MKATYVLLAAGIATLVSVAALTDVRLYPDLVVGVLPVLLFAIMLATGGVAQVKHPAWFRLAFAFGMWGACAGMGDGARGHLLCGLAFGTIGLAAGIEIEMRRTGNEKQPG